jgi:predicted nucleotidyltransferase
MFDTRVLDEAVRVRKARLESERVELLQRVVETLKTIRQPCGIGEAYVVGSLLAMRGWHQHADVDVAVGGCSGEVLEVMRVLEEVTGKEVDVIDLDRHPSPDSFRKRGLKVYG